MRAPWYGGLNMTTKNIDQRTGRVIKRLQWSLQAVLWVGVVAALWQRQWLTGVVTLGIVLLTLAPLWLERSRRLFIPPEVELLTIVFVFTSLFLGEVRGYYGRFWWWDIPLHGASGALLGTVGFLLVYLLNEREDIGVELRPGFIALFAFLFAVAIGALWEIFEFTMDGLLGWQMQKPMFGDASGLTDTMWDLILDTVGAGVIALLGYGFLRQPERTSFLERWIAALIAGNPGWFRRKEQTPGGS